MIYFDNAATTRNKPQEVVDAFLYYVNEIGVSPGRGAYPLAIQASRMLFQTRKTVALFFGLRESSNVAFTKNSTEAINLFFNGFLQKGDHVLISPFEHNSVLRPLHNLKEQGIIDYTILLSNLIYNSPQSLKDYVKKSTKLIALTLASNLTGQIVFSRRLAEEAHNNDISVFVDSSQGAGKLRPSLLEDKIDYLAFTGHKDLLALPGVGGLISPHNLNIHPLLQGGTGIHGEQYTNPSIVPDGLEAGTLNMPAIWSLKISLDYIISHFDEIRKRESDLLSHLLDKLSKMDHIILYNQYYDRVPTICFNVRDMASSDVVSYLGKNDICVRGGIHCAILAHQELNTVKSGAVRVSLNFTNTFDQINEFINTIGALKCHI